MDHTALLRGVNVGTAKRVAMADLRRVAADLGFEHPETLLNSGNLVFGASSVLGADDAAGLRAAIARATGVDADLVLLDAERFGRLAVANPLRDDGNDGREARDDSPAPEGREGREPKLLSVAFAEVPGALDGVAPPDVDLGDEELVVSPDAVYQWLPAGVLASRVPAAWWRGLPTPVTARNDATVRKLEALLARRAP
ncbi:MULTISPECIES: DUF1697 domain-containing protein [unclassified Frigoribacterium]|uniref:DUF1697 domain-containing protein n=1 Tax=unclassified Frigoribacterium TaxID=2627005 RepID=UPI0006F527F3|nr:MULTISPECIES: DUF1697 domain-containing protein [unclassified Frigoribacterium]KQO47340.1 hypothetical protein ASF07_07220 [Frigoribacterium sp. Leaf254]KQT39433.1 hypothetical protein ASG28_07230 [Frigoribacterium sp. Leaf415]